MACTNPVYDEAWNDGECLKDVFVHVTVGSPCGSRAQCKEIQLFNCRPLPLKPDA